MRTSANHLRLLCLVSMASACLASDGSGGLSFDEERAPAGASHEVRLERGQETIGTGVAFLDCDGDGDPDLLITSRVGSNSLLINDGSGAFVDRAAGSGLALATHDSTSALAADVNGDGIRDVFIGGHGESRLLLGEGDCTFTDVTAAAGVAGSGATLGAAFGDYDADGALDLYVANHSAVPLPLAPVEPERQDRLYHNNGDGTFEDVSARLPDEMLLQPSFAATFTDVDRDGDVDLWVVADSLADGVRNWLLRNDGRSAEGHRFTPIAAAAGVDSEANAMGIALADPDLDGDLDAFVSDVGQASYFRNAGDGTFDEVSWDVGLVFPTVLGDQWLTWGPLFADFDCDGDEDLMVAAGGLETVLASAGQPNALFENQGDGTFLDVRQSVGVELIDLATRSLAAADVDLDGSLDVLAGSFGGPAVLLRGRGCRNHWLSVELVGTVSNTDGIGAWVTLTTPDGRRQVRERRAGDGLGVSHGPSLHFGLGSHRAASLEIRWPSGVVQESLDVEVDRRIRLVEP